MPKFRFFLSPRIPCSLFIAVMLLFTLPVTAPAEDRTIAVMPFNVRAGGDYQHLKKAIPDMFASRIARAQGVSLLSGSRIKALEIDPADLDQDSALQKGSEIGADFVLYGSLTVIQESWSMDASLLDVSRKRLVESFFRSGADIKELIPAVDSMAGDIKSVFKEMDEPGKQIAKPESRQAPEKTKPGRDAPYAGFEAAGPTRTDLPGAWSGPDMEHNFTGLAAGDVTGDGRTETVLADSHGVYIYSLHGNRFQRLEKIDIPGNAQCIALATGDINQNGRAEIFVTARNNRGDMLRSFVIEYQNGKYRRITQKQPWFYRVANAPGTKNPILLGQRHRAKADPFEAEVVKLTYTEGQYVPGDVFLSSDAGINVLSLAVGRVPGQGAGAVRVALGREDRLQVFDSGGHTLWRSRDKYGGSTLFLKGPVKGAGSGNKRFYLPGRTLMCEPDQTSAQVFVFRNKGLSPVSLERLRVFDEGELLCLSWDRGRLQEHWKTRSYEGHFRDLAMGDVNGDGRPELAALLIKKEGAMLFSSPVSKVLIFPLQPEG